jgi:hypothetical protein
MSTTYTLYSTNQVFGAAGSPANTLASVPATTIYVAAFYDGEMRSRIFDASVALPTLNASFAPPGVNAYASTPTTNGLYQVASGTANGIVGNWQVGYVYGYSTVGAYGQYIFQLTYAAGSADAGSPSIFETDAYLTLVCSGASTG